MIEADASGTASKEYGINRDSILNDLVYFHVCNCSLIPDVMHDILEGALQYEIKLMLQFMVNTQGYFTLKAFNSHLENIELGYIESNNRPTTISSKTFNLEGNSLRQNGLCFRFKMYFNMVFSLADVALGTDFASCYRRLCT